MNKNDKIYIAGHKGLVGTAIVKELKKQGFTNLITVSRSELDITNQNYVNNFFDQVRPDYVILAAAKVGGIYSNNTFPADFIYQNILIEANIIHLSYKYNVKRLLFLGSSCIYPKFATQPMKEDCLLTGILEHSNEPYAIAKIAGIKLCESYNRQYNTDFRSIMPTNLYGINDNFDPQNSHVIGGLISRMHTAKINNDSEFNVWGSGKAKREFLYVDDMAKASLFVLSLDTQIYQKHTNIRCSHINIGTGSDITIKELVYKIKDIINFKGKINFDSTKIEGTPQKLLDVSKINKLGWKYKINLEDGLKKTYKWYVENIANLPKT